MSEGWTRTTCPYCRVGCGVLARPRNDGSAEIKGDPEHPANFGRLCSKGSALGETLSLDGRLLKPIVDGVEADWDEAQPAAQSARSLPGRHREPRDACGQAACRAAEFLQVGDVVTCAATRPKFEKLRDLAGFEGYQRAPGALIAINRVERDRRRRGAGATERESGGARRRSGS